MGKLETIGMQIGTILSLLLENFVLDFSFAYFSCSFTVMHRLYGTLRRAKRACMNKNTFYMVKIAGAL